MGSENRGARPNNIGPGIFAKRQAKQIANLTKASGILSKVSTGLAILSTGISVFEGIQRDIGRGYFFPKTYISTYFIRNIHYYVINKNKYKLNKLFNSLKLNPLTKFQNIELLFKYKNRTKIIKIVKNNRTKTTILMSLLLQSKYYLDTIFRKDETRLFKYEFINEVKYEKEDGNIKEKPSIKQTNDL